MIRLPNATVDVELSQGIKMIATGNVDTQENRLTNAVAYGVHHHIALTALSRPSTMEIFGFCPQVRGKEEPEWPN